MAGGVAGLTRATVDLGRLAANYRVIAAFAGRAVMPIVKADAYGHGAARVSQRLESLGAPMLGVAYPEEGAALRAAGVRVPILVMAGFGPEQAMGLIENALVPVVSSKPTLEAVMRAAPSSGAPAEVHLKVDTGMTRLGFEPAGVVAAALRLADAGRVRVTGLMTQLAAADEDAEFTKLQLDRFDEVLERLDRRGIRPPLVHAANSAGLAHLRANHTLVRPGLLLYGVKPRPITPPVDVMPVMSVSASLSSLRDVAAGTRVSYGGRWTAERPSRIAVVPLGYADGVPRTRANPARAGFSVNGRWAPVTGNVCMDMTMIDVTENADARVGSEAVLFGDEPGAWAVGEWAGTHAWQILTAVGARVPRRYVENGAELPA